MIKLAYANVGNLNLSEAYKLLPESRKKKFDNFRFEKDKRLSAGAYLLLDELLKEENITQPAFKIGEYGKAYTSNQKNQCINRIMGIKHMNRFRPIQHQILQIKSWKIQWEVDEIQYNSLNKKINRHNNGCLNTKNNDVLNYNFWQSFTMIDSVPSNYHTLSYNSNENHHIKNISFKRVAPAYYIILKQRRKE